LIIDAHTHIWEDEDVKGKHYRDAMEFWAGPKVFPFKVDEIVADIKEAGMDKIVSLAMDAGPWWKAKTPNETVAKWMKKYPDAIIGFASVCPINEMGRYKRESLKELEKAIVDYRLKGLKLGPPYWGNYLPTDPKLYPIYDRAVEFNIPIMFHQSIVSMHPETIDRSFPRVANIRNALPIYLDEVADDFPELKMIIAHCGKPHYEETFYLMHKNPNIYTDLAALPLYGENVIQRVVLLAKDYGVIDRVLFGTDGPAAWCSGGIKSRYYPRGHRGIMPLSWKDYLDYVRVKVNQYAERMGHTPLSQKEIDGILGTNAMRFLGL